MSDGPVRELGANQPNTVGDYVEILRRRKWMIILLPLIAGLAAVMFSRSQPPLYKATARVLVKRTSIVTLITQAEDPATTGDPNRFLATQADIARAPELAARVAAAAGVPGLTGREVLTKSSVTPKTNADLLDISVSARHRRDAVRIANTYADQLTLYKTEIDTDTINEAVDSLKTKAASLRANGNANSASYATLIQQVGQLETVGKLLASNTKVLQPADGATKIRPRPRRNGILSFLFGGILGVGLAFLAEALDRRVRSEREIEDALGLPVLARIPKPRRRLRKSNDLVMLAEPRSVEAETFRKLRTSVEFVNLDHGARTIMVTSAVQREGKSTTIANLAVAFARAGRRVALVDLDLHRPILHRFFHVGPAPGITDVVVGRVTLADAARPIALTSAGSLRSAPSSNGRRGIPSDSTNGRSELSGLLHLLPAGTLPPSPSEFLERERIQVVIDEIAEHFDLVFIDAPPLLAFGDAMSLSAKIDAIFAVARLNVVHRATLQELGRQLQNCQATVLGIGLTGIRPADAYRYGYDAYGYNVDPKTSRIAERA
jgi:polysaccharide biosynthesis transport protein